MHWETSINILTKKIWHGMQEKKMKGLSWDSLRFNYRAEHNRLVLSIGMEMGRTLGADMEVLKAAILLHDIGRSIVKKGHGEAGAEMAGEILKDTDFPSEKIPDVQYAISRHMGWDESMPETLEACILWDADKLSKLGASIIIQKTMLLPLKGKNTWDALSEFNKWLKTAEYIKDHMKTGLGSEMAKGRFLTLELFVSALNRELARNNPIEEDLQ